MADHQGTAVHIPNDARATIRVGGHYRREKEGAVGKHVRVPHLQEGASNSEPSGGGQMAPVKGGPKAQALADDQVKESLPSGSRTVYVLARKRAEYHDTPVFTAGDSGQEEAVIVFTTQNLAMNYLQTTGGRDTHEAVPLSPLDLDHWLEAVRAEGIGWLVVNLGAQGHPTQQPQPALSLRERVELTGEDLIEELSALGD